MSNHFLDVGANIGQTFTEFLCHDAKYDGWTVWCFEPSPRHLPELMKTAEMFRHRYHVKICPFGIAGETGFRTFHPKDDPRGDSFEEFLETDHETINLNIGYELISPCMGINDFFSRYSPIMQRVILKLDCEGLEYEILDALNVQWTQLETIMVEWHNIGSPHKSREELMRKFPKLESWTL